MPVLSFPACLQDSDETTVTDRVSLRFGTLTHKAA